MTETNKRIKITKDITNNGKFENKIINVDYDNKNDCIAGYCTETQSRCEFGIFDEYQVLGDEE